MTTCKADHPSCGPNQQWDGTLGRCVAKTVVLDAWSPERELQRLKNEVQTRADMKRRIRQDPDVGLSSLGNRQVDDRQDPDEFLEDELLLALALSKRAFQVADEEVLPLFDDGQVLPEDPARFNQQRLDEANDKADTVWRNVIWSATLGTAAASLINRSFKSGEAVISKGILDGAPSVDQVLRNMLDVTQFRTNEFFNTQVMPSIQNKINGLFETGAFDQVSLDPIRKTLDRRLKSVPYWRVVANAAASRAYHYGVLKASQSQGFTGYRFVAILDDRTSDICRDLNGKEFFIADAVNKFERVAGSDDPDEVKKVFPWVKVDDVRGLSNDALRDLGVQVPPLHGNCRSTLRPIF